LELTLYAFHQRRYFILNRRTRRFLEKNFPDVFGPQVLVMGMSILSDENLIWASQLFYSHYWGESYDLNGDGKCVQARSASISAMSRENENEERSDDFTVPRR